MQKVLKNTAIICSGLLTALDNYYLRLALMVVVIILFNLTINED